MKMKRCMVMLATIVLAGLTAGVPIAQASTFVQVSQIICSSQQEVGADEIYLKMDGVKTHIGDFYQTNSKMIDVHKWSNSPITVELWESDGDHWYDRDDFMGQVTFNSSSNTNGLFRFSIGGTCCTPPTIYFAQIKACQTGTPNCPSPPPWFCSFFGIC